jgi:hypothetical protein
VFIGWSWWPYDHIGYLFHIACNQVHANEYYNLSFG